jgi:hypothetical protein
MHMRRNQSSPPSPVVLLLFALGLLALAALTACAATTGVGGGDETTITGSGTPAAGTRQVSDFHAIVFSSVGELSIQQTGVESLRIEADADVLPLLTSTVSNGTLTLGTQPNTTFQTSDPIHYTLTVKSLDTFDESGAGAVTATGIAANSLSVQMSGTGAVTMAGNVSTLKLNLTGTGTFDGSELASKTATVVVGGTGHAVVNVSDALDATVSGVGVIEYLGDPKVTSHVTGVGTIRKR